MEALNEIRITDIPEVFTISANRGKSVEIKNRKTYALSFCKSGKITYNHNGRKFISDKNCAIIIPQNQSYSLYNNLSGEFTVINFCCEKNICDTFICIPISRSEDYIEDYERIRTLFIRENRKLKAISILYDIFDRLSNENKNENEILSKAIRYINDNFCDSEINNNAIANSVNISEVYLRKLFKEKYDTSPRQYIVAMRIRLAKRLLIETACPIEAIAERCGFSSVYHFCHTFKKHTVFTPTDYRKKYRLGI